MRAVLAIGMLKGNGDEQLQRSVEARVALVERKGL